VAEEDADLASFYEMDRRSSRRQSEINEEAVKALFYDPRAKELDPDRHPRPELEPHNHVDAVLGFFSGLLAPKAAADDTDLAHFYEQEHSKSRRQSEINEEAVKAAFYDPRAKELDPERHPRPDLEPHVDTVGTAPTTWTSSCVVC